MSTDLMVNLLYNMFFIFRTSTTHTLQTAGVLVFALLPLFVEPFVHVNAFLLNNSNNIIKITTH